MLLATQYRPFPKLQQYELLMSQPGSMSTQQPAHVHITGNMGITPREASRKLVVHSPQQSHYIQHTFWGQIYVTDTTRNIEEQLSKFTKKIMEDVFSY